MCFTGRKSSTGVRSFVPKLQHLRPLLPFVSRVVGKFNPLRQIAENSHSKSASAEHKNMLDHALRDDVAALRDADSGEHSLSWIDAVP